MDDNNGSLSRRFSNAANMSFRDWAVQVRVRGAIKRMNERFEKCEPALTQARYRDLLTKQGSSPELKPSYAAENPQDRMWRAAKQWVRYDHQGRVNKIREVGDKMMSKDRGLER